MKERLRFDVWIVGLLVGLCLLGATVVAYRINAGGIRDILRPIAISSSFALSDVASVAVLKETNSQFDNLSTRIVSKVTPSGNLHQKPRTTVPINRTPVAVRSTRRVATPPPVPLSGQVVRARDPEKRLLKTLGYVQKADGTVQAIVSQEDNTVLVVHVGDTFGDKFTVAKISTDTVELVTASTQLNGPATPTEIASDLSSRAMAASVIPAPPTIKKEQIRITTLPPTIAGNDKPNQLPKRSDLHLLFSETIGQNKLTEKRESLKEAELAGKSLAPATQLMAGLPGFRTGDGAMSNLPVTRPQGLGTDQNQLSRFRIGTDLALPGVPTRLQTRDARPAGSVRALGFVEKANGQVQAILDGDSGVTLVQVRAGSPNTLAINNISTRSAGPTDTSSVRAPPAAVLVASNSLIASYSSKNPPITELLWEDSRTFRHLQSLRLRRGLEPPSAWRLEPWEPLEKPPPGRGPPVDENGTGPIQWPEAGLSSGQGRAVKDPDASSEPRATGLKSIGYVEWQDGRAQSVVDDGEGGVRLIEPKETHGASFAVAVIHAGEVEITETLGSTMASNIESASHGSPTGNLSAQEALPVELPLFESRENSPQYERKARQGQEESSAPEDFGRHVAGKSFKPKAPKFQPSPLPRGQGLNEMAPKYFPVKPPTFSPASLKFGLAGMTNIRALAALDLALKGRSIVCFDGQGLLANYSPSRQARNLFMPNGLDPKDSGPKCRVWTPAHPPAVGASTLSQ